MNPLSIGNVVADGSQVDDDGRVWVFGKRYEQRSGYCFAAKGGTVKLQLRTNRGGWVTVSTSKRYVKDAGCREQYGAKLPYKPVYTFMVSEIGERVGEGKRVLQAREVVGRNEYGYFTKTVYESMRAYVDALAGSLVDEVADRANGL